MLKVNAFFFSGLIAMKEILLRNSPGDLKYYHSVYFAGFALLRFIVLKLSSSK